MIAVVSHSGFLRLGISHAQYANADYRVFDFAPVKPLSARTVEYSLIEWEETRRCGGGMGRSPQSMWAPRVGDFPPEEQSDGAGEQQTNGEAFKEKP